MVVGNFDVFLELLNLGFGIPLLYHGTYGSDYAQCEGTL
jgi:hypothetical protein